MNVGVIGLGSMGGMLARGLLRSASIAPAELWVANRSATKLTTLRAEWPAVHSGSVSEVAAHADVLFICVPTSEAMALLAALGPRLRATQLLVVISNALSLAAVAGRVPCAVAKLIPSVTQEAAAGSALLMLPPGAAADVHERLSALLSRLGSLVVVPEELGRACADLTSAGPALLAYVLAEMASAASACEPRLDPALAWQLVRSAAAGTAALLETLPPQALIERVATPGGITEIGLATLGSTVPQAWREVFTRMEARQQQTERRRDDAGKQ